MPLLITGVASLDEDEVVDDNDDGVDVDRVEDLGGDRLSVWVTLLLLLGLRLMTLDGVLLAFFRLLLLLSAVS